VHNEQTTDPPDIIKPYNDGEVQVTQFFKLHVTQKGILVHATQLYN
jgi:hypothetical protein